MAASQLVPALIGGPNAMALLVAGGVLERTAVGDADAATVGWWRDGGVVVGARSLGVASGATDLAAAWSTRAAGAIVLSPAGARAVGGSGVRGGAGGVNLRGAGRGGWRGHLPRWDDDRSEGALPRGREPCP